MTNRGFVSAVALCVCAAACGRSEPAKEVPAPAAAVAPVTAPASVTEAELAEFEKRFGGQKMWPAFKQAFPQDYQETVSRLIGMAKAGADLEQINADTIQATQAVRTKYADQGAKAPDAQLIKLISAQLSMHMHVREAKGPAVCDAYATQGLPALLPDTDTFQGDIEDQAVVVFETLAEGRDHPAPVEPPTDADLKLVLADVVKHGISEAMVAQLGDAKNPPPAGARCLYQLQFLKSVIAVPGEAGHRVRADMAKSLLAGAVYR